MKQLLSLVVFLVVYGCGLDGNTNKKEIESTKAPKTDAQGQQVVDGYAYELLGDSCTTGFHSSSSLKEYCAILIDETANANCAKTARTFAFDQDCK